MNHSLRATLASRMFQSNVPEQIIKEVTGHRSDCVRTYKRTSDDIRKDASEKISGDSKGGKVEKVGEIKEKVREKSESIDNVLSAEGNVRLNESLTACQIIKNVVRTRMEMRKKAKKGVRGVKKCVSKLLRKNRKINASRVGTKAKKGRIVIEVNVNIKM